MSAFILSLQFQLQPAFQSRLVMQVDHRALLHAGTNNKWCNLEVLNCTTFSAHCPSGIHTNRMVLLHLLVPQDFYFLLFVICSLLSRSEDSADEGRTWFCIKYWLYMHGLKGTGCSFGYGSTRVYAYLNQFHISFRPPLHLNYSSLSA